MQIWGRKAFTLVILEEQLNFKNIPLLFLILNRKPRKNLNQDLKRIIFYRN